MRGAPGNLRFEFSRRHRIKIWNASAIRDYLRKVLRWQRGRQDSGYDKMLLLQSMWPIPFDVYLLRFPTGSQIQPHVDQVERGAHYRLNLVLRRARSGGEFVCATAIRDSPRIKFFRPDVSEHAVTRIESGTRYVLSIGWVRQSTGN